MAYYRLDEKLELELKEGAPELLMFEARVAMAVKLFGLFWGVAIFASFLPARRAA